MLSRRSFLCSAAALPLVPWEVARRPIDPFVNASRLRSNLEELSLFGRPTGGSFADGVSRVGYSQADVQGRAYVMKLMRGAGLEPRIDPAGNIFARRAGRDAGAQPVLFGSHIDSVPSGGNFDGDLGSLAALEALRVCDERRIVTRRPLDIVVWANEEGVAFGNGLCGSRAAAGELVDGELEHVWNGVRKADAIRGIGGAPDRIQEARIAPGSFHAYVELHIEQGGTLDRTATPIGIVEGIVAIDRYAVTIRGFANHAGTTAMGDRRDALVAASTLTLAVREIVTAEPGRQVGTVGHLTVSPNAPNVVPGEVRLTVELRDLSSGKIAALGERIKARAAAIAAETGSTIDMTPTSHHESALATGAVQEAVAGAAEKLGLEARRLPSGAGHDAQMMARLGPMGMIFVPSIGGVSHSPRELTTWEDCARGAEVLLHTVLALAE
jgi:N-carbamoyl-L-amino-acid hydrolase